MRKENHIACDSELYKIRQEIREAELDRDRQSRFQAKQLQSLHKHYSARIITLTDKIIELTGGPVGIKLKDERLEKTKDDGFVDIDQAPPEDIRNQILNGN